MLSIFGPNVVIVTCDIAFSSGNNFHFLIISVQMTLNLEKTRFSCGYVVSFDIFCKALSCRKLSLSDFLCSVLSKIVSLQSCSPCLLGINLYRTRRNTYRTFFHDLCLVSSMKPNRNSDVFLIIIFLKLANATSKCCVI